MIYLKIIFLTLVYVGQRYPCTTAGLLVWCIGCIGIAVSRSFPFGDESYCRSNWDDSISQMDVCSIG